MAELTVQETAEDGGITFGAADSNGDEFVNDGRTLLAVKNGGGSSVTVTVTAQNTSTRVKHWGDITKANGGAAVAAGGIDLFGPFPSRPFNDADGKVQVTYSGVTSVEVAAVKLPL